MLKNTLFFGLLLNIFLVSCTPSKRLLSDPYAAAIEAHRESYKQNFLNAANSPLDKKGVRKLVFYPADSVFKIEGKFTKTSNAKPFDLPTSNGKMKQYVEYGKITLSIRDTVCTLTIYQSLQLRTMPQYKDYLFLPFKDFTNGESTYGGGRYLDFKMSDIQENQTIIIDFNKAYNPYCAYSDGYSCPIPPSENHLQVFIEAGEKNIKDY